MSRNLFRKHLSAGPLESWCRPGTVSKKNWQKSSKIIAYTEKDNICVCVMLSGSSLLTLGPLLRFPAAVSVNTRLIS